MNGVESSPPGIERPATKPAGGRQEYLVEHYRPGVTVGEFRNWAARVRESADEMEREGNLVRYLRSTIVPVDEALLCVLEAASEELVHETYARAGISYDRISAAIAADEGADRIDGYADRRGLFSADTNAAQPVQRRAASAAHNTTVARRRKT